jgi:predicted nucleotidyltransferase
MNNELSLLFKEKLRNNCSEAYFYGSQTVRINLEKDIDIAIVCEQQEIYRIAKILSRLQESIQQLIHPIFINHNDIVRNPGFKKIVSNGIRII